MSWFKKEAPEVLSVKKVYLLPKKEDCPDHVIRIHNRALSAIGRGESVKLTNLENGREMVAEVWGSPSGDAAFKGSEPGVIYMHYNQMAALGIRSNHKTVNLSGSIATQQDIINFQVKYGDVTAIGTKWSQVGGIASIIGGIASIIAAITSIASLAIMVQ